jgi:membrane-associated protease RseP (regulator of RpoE activity)
MPVRAAQSFGEAVTMAFVLMWVALFGAVAVHELAHVLCALALRVPVRRVVVGVGPRWPAVRLHARGLQVELRPVPLEGMADVDLDRTSPGRAALVCVAGPAASIALGLAVLAGAEGLRGLIAGVRTLAGIPAAAAAMIAAGLRWQGPPAGGVAGVGTTVGALALLSVIVGGVQLLPVLPLDGGWIVWQGLRAAGVRVPRRAATAVGVGVLLVMNLPLFAPRLSPTQALAAVAAGLAAFAGVRVAGGLVKRWSV